MFPDLRLLISATVVTFFLAAMAGLYASLRTQDQIVARTENRTATDESPITRISSAWPLLPEPGRAAAMRELTRIAKHPPFADRGGGNAAPDATRSGMPATGVLTRDTTGSTGIVAPEPAAADHPDVQGNIVNVPETGNARARAGKKPVVSAKKAPRVANRPVVKRLIVSGPGSASAPASISAPANVSRPRSASARPPAQPAHPVEPLIIGYPLYSTVPVTN